MKIKEKRKAIVISFFTIMIVLIVFVVIYLCTGDLCASREVFNYLKSTDEVKITRIEEGYYFDGPGEESAIIFYPGAKVEFTSYSQLMHSIAQNGRDCFLVEMPFNIAIFGSSKATKIINNYSYKHWYMSGHSLGGVIAASYVSNNPEKVDGIIMLASYPSKEMPNNVEYVSIYGTEDKVLNAKSYEKSKRYLPENAKEIIIDGGNHSGFGNYGLQKGDGESKISREEQIIKVIEAIDESF